MKSANQEECVLCCSEITIHATGFCDHPVCYECSARMRVLCETNECPICRSDMPQVVFTSETKLFSDVSGKCTLFNGKYKILFENAKIKESFEILLINKCQICEEVLPSFGKLKEHMRRKHEQHYCDLCTDNLKIFTSERKSYNRKDLARHKIRGDPDQTSHRGHPLCEFCDMRYVDLDELYRHLRREHFFCHLCDADGTRQFYKDYGYLRTHFRKDHHLCEEGDCANEQFTSAFRSEIDLRAHKAIQHSKNMSKAEAKQTRILDFSFNYVPHARPTSSSSPRGRRYVQQRNNVEEQNSNDRYSSKKEPELEPLDTHSTQEFPYLSDEYPSESVSALKATVDTMPLTLQSFARNPAPCYRRNNVMSAEDFPALGSAALTVTSELPSYQNFTNNTQNNASTRVTNMPSQSSRKLLIPEDPKPDTKPNGKNAQQMHPKWISKRENSNFEEDFPKLEIKTPVSTSIVTKSSSFQNYTSVVSPQQSLASDRQYDSGDQFVVIKSKSKKKKQNKSLPEEDELSATLALLNNGSKFKNQENEDPFKKRMVHPLEITRPPSYKESETWEQKVSFGQDDFPPLEVMKKPPPGLNVKKARVPPPGFSANSKVTTHSSLSMSSIARIVENSLQNNLNSEKINGVSNYSQTNHFYQQPPNSQLRNECLLKKINDLSYTPEKLQEFKNVSRNFRSSIISAAEYYSKCLEILGEVGLQDIFPELVSLLPDITKQQELLAIHNNQHNSNLKRKNNFKNKNNVLSSCDLCNQVLLVGDCASHSCVS